MTLPLCKDVGYRWPKKSYCNTASFESVLEVGKPMATGSIQSRLTSREIPFCRIKVKLLMLLSDYRGKPKEARHSGAPGYVGACYKCGIKGCPGAAKTIYAGKAFLSKLP